MEQHQVHQLEDNKLRFGGLGSLHHEVGDGCGPTRHGRHGVHL